MAGENIKRDQPEKVSTLQQYDGTGIWIWYEYALKYEYEYDGTGRKRAKEERETYLRKWVLY